MTKPKAAWFPFVPRQHGDSVPMPMPILPLELHLAGKSVRADALVDSGSAINVIPFDVGLALGAIWSDCVSLGPLAGNLTSTESRGIVAMCTVADFAPIRQFFAWLQTNNAPVIVGQANFFAEFDVCFYRRRGFFTVVPSATP